MNHWLAIMKKLNNWDKHSALIFHVTTVEPRASWDVEYGNGKSGSGTGPDDGTEIPKSYTDASGKFVRVVNVKRQLTARITFQEWGEIPFPIEVRNGLSTFRDGTADLVSAFAPFLRPKRGKGRPVTALIIQPRDNSGGS